MGPACPHEAVPGGLASEYKGPMTTSVQPEGVRGTVEPGFEPVIDRLRESVAADPSFAGTLCVYHHGRLDG